MCDARLFAPQITDLRQTSLVADMGGEDNIPDLARAVLASAPAEFALAGLSMGGILAFEMWRQAPARISHLALMDTTPYADAPDRSVMRVSQMARALDGQLEEIAKNELKPLYLAERNRDDTELLELLFRMAIEQGPDVFNRQSQALKERQDSVSTLATIDCPVTIICGREDSLCPVAAHEFMASRIPAARLVILNDCGHMATLEQPTAVNRELRRLFEQ